MTENFQNRGRELVAEIHLNEEERTQVMPLLRRVLKFNSAKAREQQ
jgi:hypothetical protein